MAADIGSHLASLNLFREADGRVFITVAGATGALTEAQAAGRKPMGHLAVLIGEAGPRFVESWQAEG